MVDWKKLTAIKMGLRGKNGACIDGFFFFLFWGGGGGGGSGGRQGRNLDFSLEMSKV